MIKIKRESIYLYALAIYFWEATFFATLSWKESIAPVFYNIASFCRLISFGLLAGYVLIGINRKLSKKYLLAAVVIGCSYLSYMVIGENIFINTATFVVLSFAVDFDKILKVYFKNLISCLFAILLVTVLGLTNNKMVEFTYATGYSLGTGHPNVFAALVFNAVMLYIYIYLKDKRAKSVVVAVCAALVVWSVTASRTVTILLLLYVVIMMIYTVMEKMKIPWAIRGLKFIAVIIVIGSIYFMTYDGGQVFSFDQNFAVRFTQAANIFRTYGIHLFGSNIEFVTVAEAEVWGGRDAVILDNAYLRLFLYNGIVCLIIFLAGMAQLLSKICRRKDNLLLIITILFIIGGLMEKSVYTFQLNFTLLGIMSAMSFGPRNRAKR